jgi:hypothetical protein
VIENEIEEIMDDEDTIDICTTKEYFDLVYALKERVMDKIYQFYMSSDDSATIKIRIHPVLLHYNSSSKSLNTIPLDIQRLPIFHKIDWEKDKKTRQKILENVACSVLSLSNYRYATNIRTQNSIFLKYNTVIFTVTKRKEEIKIGSR